MIDYLKLNQGDIVQIKDSPIGKPLKVVYVLKDIMVQLVDLDNKTAITIEKITQLKKEPK
jgi:hypothetical protein